MSSSMYGGVSLGGPSGAVQFNSAGAFGGDSLFAWDSATSQLRIGGTIRTAIYQLGTDAGFSRLGAGSVALGNGTQGNATGTLSLATVAASTFGDGTVDPFIKCSTGGSVAIFDNASGTQWRLGGTGLRSVQRAPIQFGTPDVGISGPSAGLICIGNGTGGDFTGAIKLGAITQDNATAATSGVSQSSPIQTMSGRYWTGAASAVDSWAVQSILGNGTNGVSRLTFTHTPGSTGLAQVDFSGVPANGTGPILIRSSVSSTAGISFGDHAAVGASIYLDSVGGTGVDVLRFYLGGASPQIIGAIQTNTVTKRMNIGTYANNNWNGLSLGFLSPPTNIQTAVVNMGWGTWSAGSTSPVGICCGTYDGAPINIAGNNTLFGMPWAPSSGAAQFTFFNINPSVNQTGTATGVYTGLKVNVTETAYLGSVTGSALIDLQVNNNSLFKVDRQGNLTQNNPIAATSGVSQSSPIQTLSGRYWDGAASQIDQWTMQNVIANGTNGASTLTLVHSGSTAQPQMQIPSGTTLTTPNITGSAGGSGSGIHVGNSASIPLAIIFSTVGSNDMVRFYGAGNLLSRFTYQASSKYSAWQTNEANSVAGMTGFVTTGLLPAVVFGGTTFVGTGAGTQTGVSAGSSENVSGNVYGTLVFAPTSGPTNFTAFRTLATINQTGSSSGNYTGLLVNIIETALKGSANLLLDLQSGVTGGTSQFAITNAGKIKIPSTNTAASATAGASGAPPAQVAGYLIVNIGGTDFKIPYYAV